MTIRIPHYLVDNEFRIVVDVKPLDLELSGDVQTVNEGLILCHIVCHTEMQSNYIE
jgi:hypothetical protein